MTSDNYTYPQFWKIQANA